MASHRIEPACQTLIFDTASIPAGQTRNFVVDISQCASLMNRRFYRQGLQWPVAGFKFLSRGSGSLSGQVAITKLPTTWVLSNAWVKGFKHWEEMNADALEGAESIRPRFLDFKIFADAAHHIAGVSGNLLPAALGSIAVPGEWESSKVVIPVSQNTDPTGVTGYEVIATGANYPGISPVSGKDAVSLIEGYAASRLLPNVLDPNAPDDAADASGVNPENWLVAMDNEGLQQDSVVIEDMITENNIAPYPFENDGVHLDTMYPGGANQLPGLMVHDFGDVSQTTIGATTRLKGGLFPCGLISFTFVNNSETSVSHSIIIDLVPGHNRGYLTQKMQEMN